MIKASEVLGQLKDAGILLVQDRNLRCIVTLVSGPTWKGSWWKHPGAHHIFQIIEELSDHPDVLITKLIRGKVTMVHRHLWPDVLAIGMSREPWQMKNLSKASQNLLQKVDEGELVLATGAAMKELEKRLLVHSESVHTEGGKHAVRLESWAAWNFRNRIRMTHSVADAKSNLEHAVVRIGGGVQSLPWHT